MGELEMKGTALGGIFTFTVYIFKVLLTTNILGMNLIEIMVNIILAFIVGCVGAIGGWLTTKLLKKYDEKNSKRLH